eukprot:CAMPEP_0119518000 /NCGR_PEP_ID=MMETSP1344-20130328/34739_1 /TAXON_ID=236787 /ORGANISM="Florenciella parvula, Strain CCMP2471" /LENGTH=176 /DNA_ID=CAMNT_0007555645 /DNA_START=26 /DNA_END=556 /DNA_ORIENTATION=+
MGLGLAFPAVFQEKAANAACLPGEVDLECIGVFKDYGYSPPRTLTPADAKVELESTRVMVAGLEVGVLASRWDEVGLSILEVFPKLKALQKHYLMAEKGRPAIDDDTSIRVERALFDMEMMVADAMRGADAKAPPILIQVNVLQTYKELVASMDAFAAAAASADANKGRRGVLRLG